MCSLWIYKSDLYDCISPRFEYNRNIYFCITIGNVTSYCTMLCLTWGHIQIWSSYNFENIMCYWNLKVWVELYETIWEMYPCMSKVYYLFIQIIYFFWQTDEPKICCKIIFYHFLSHLHAMMIVMCDTLEQEFWIVPTRQ